MLPFQDARKLVIHKTAPHILSYPRQVSKKNLADALGDALAQEVRADRDYPPFDRSTRDGYAVRASDAAKGATLRVLASAGRMTPVHSTLPATAMRPNAAPLHAGRRRQMPAKLIVAPAAPVATKSAYGNDKCVSP